MPISCLQFTLQVRGKIYFFPCAEHFVLKSFSNSLTEASEFRNALSINQQCRVNLAKFICLSRFVPYSGTKIYASVDTTWWDSRVYCHRVAKNACGFLKWYSITSAFLKCRIINNLDGERLIWSTFKHIDELYDSFIKELFALDSELDFKGFVFWETFSFVFWTLWLKIRACMIHGSACSWVDTVTNHNL